MLDRSGSEARTAFDDDDNDSRMIVAHTRSFRKALETGGVHIASEQEVQRSNGMQAGSATRYLFASTDENFSVVESDAYT